MSEPSDPIDKLLRNVFKAGMPEPEYAADDAPPEEVSSELKARVLGEARRLSTRLLARRLCDAGEEAGLNIDDLASEAFGCEAEAKRFLQGEGTPLELEPGHVARMFFRARFGPNEWRVLLFQAVTSEAVYPEVQQGEVWGRTTELSNLQRAERLVGAKSQPRDAAWAERVARGFVDEVLDEWQKLTSRTK